ncbi:MAG: hypothetical protein E7326_00740 [Clostridiales bacterium]|nr:hypothetical protein [Clostridiales bacterium]
MFDNIGGKIKNLARTTCILGIIGSIIVAIALFSSNSNYEPTIGAGFAWLIIGPLVSWLSCLTLYGFGELVENSTAILNTLTSSKHHHVNAISAVQDETNWICSTCGTSNPHYIGRCPNCNTYR